MEALRLIYKVLVGTTGKYMATLCISDGLVISSGIERDTYKEAVEDFLVVCEQFEHLKIFNPKEFVK